MLFMDRWLLRERSKDDTIIRDLFLGSSASGFLGFQDSIV